MSIWLRTITLVSVNNVHKAAMLYHLWIMCVYQNWYLDPCLIYLSTFAKQYDTLAAMIRMFVSFSSVRLLAPLHRVLSITSPSWGPYVSQLLQRQTFSIFVFVERKVRVRVCVETLIPHNQFTPWVYWERVTNKNNKIPCVCNSVIPSDVHSCRLTFLLQLLKGDFTNFKH